MNEKPEAIEFAEANEYARLNFQLVLRWFVFHAGVNFLALGWYFVHFARSERGPEMQQFAIRLLAGFMLAQNVFGAIACGTVKAFFVSTGDRLTDLMTALIGLVGSAESNSAFLAKSPLPLKTYKSILSLMIAVIGSYFIAWVLIFVFHDQGQGGMTGTVSK